RTGDDRVRPAPAGVVEPPALRPGLDEVDVGCGIEEVVDARPRAVARVRDRPVYPDDVVRAERRLRVAVGEAERVRRSRRSGQDDRRTDGGKDANDPDPASPQWFSAPNPLDAASVEQALRECSL